MHHPHGDIPIQRRSSNMEYICINEKGQVQFDLEDNLIQIPTGLHGFSNTKTGFYPQPFNGHDALLIFGNLRVTEQDRICPQCGAKMHINRQSVVVLHHLNFGSTYTNVGFPHIQFLCPKCSSTKSQFIPFRADGHRMTTELCTYIKDLLSLNTLTLKEISNMTGIDENIVKSIDLERLKEKYTFEGHLKKPEKFCEFIGIDEFKLHCGYKFATHIIDMETGHILWIAEGKKKQVVYDFIEHVGIDWMKNVKAVACDMNSDFEEAFKEKCPHIQPVFDYFHIVKNLNEKVIGEIRKDEQKRLEAAGDKDGAKLLKRSKYILTSSRKTLEEKDNKSSISSQVSNEKETIFKHRDPSQPNGSLAEKYDELIASNSLLFTCDLLKEKLRIAYTRDTVLDMALDVIDMIELCEGSKNKHLEWFGRLLENHFDGIVAHARFQISAGKTEGINNRIKTIRRMGYGYPDDEYFFLKLIDMSHSKDMKSHQNLD